MGTQQERLEVQTTSDDYMDYDSPCPFSSASSSDSSDSDNFISIRREKRKLNMQTIDGYSNAEFKKHFRLSRDSAALLVALYESSDECLKHNHLDHPKIGARKEIHLFLWFMTHTLSYRQIANLFGLGDSITWKVINRVSSWMVCISNEHIVWPRSTEMIGQATASFEEMGRIPGVLGVIDNIHIKIRKPSLNHEVYLNSEGYHSIIIQGVVDSAKRFIDVYCGEPGSMRDSQVLRRSSLFRLASQVFKNNTFLLGDSEYPSNFWLVPPYKDTENLTEQQQKFNKIHETTRIVVQDAFRLMTYRFRKLLHFTERIDLGMVKNITVACCMLHNFCLNAKDPWDESEIEDLDDDNFNSEGEHANVDRRQQVVNELLLKNLL